MRIKTLFTASMMAVGALVLCLTGSIAIDQWQQRSAAVTAERLTAASAALLRLTEKLVIERGNLFVRLGVPLAIDAEVEARLRAVLESTDVVMAEAQRALEAGASGPLAPHFGVVENLRPRLAELRQTYLSAARRPAAERPGAVQQAVIPAYNSLLDGVSAALDTSHSSIAEMAPGLEPLVLVARMTWDMRDAASRRLLPVSAAVNGGRAVTAKDLEMSAAGKGALDMLWVRVTSLIGVIGSPPRVTRAVDEVRRRYFEDAAKRLDAMYAAGQVGTNYPMTAAEFTTFATPSMQVLLLAHPIRWAAMAWASAADLSGGHAAASAFGGVVGLGRAALEVAGREA